MLTLPCAAAVGAVAFGVVQLFGHGDAGPIVLSVVMVIALVAVFLKARGSRSHGPLPAAQPAIEKAA